MNEILTAPISSLLIIAGVICVVLAIIGSIRGKIIIDVPPEKQLLLGGVGIVFLVIGLVLGTIIQPTLIDEGIKPTSTPPITSTPTPSPTPTPIIIDTMDSTFGWKKYNVAEGSSINFTPVSGRTGNAIEISYDLKENGWVSIAKDIDPEMLSGTKGINFFYKGSGEPNTLILGLRYGDHTSFGVSLHRVTVTDVWVPIEVPYIYIDCWSEESPHYGKKLDLNNVRKIEFRIANFPEKGDVFGSGSVIIDDVQGITS